MVSKTICVGSIPTAPATKIAVKAVFCYDEFMKDEELSKQAAKHIRKSKNDLINKFANVKIYLPDDKPASVFMAGSPGAGKTEFSKDLIKELGDGVVRIDPDEIRNTLPSEIYNGTNAYLFQNAISIGVSEIYNFVLKNNQNFVLDGTMANYVVAKSNIELSLRYRNYIEIYYLYQDPIIAWKFTQDRELLEGRNITKDAFINGFVSSKNNVNKLKNDFGHQIRLNLVIKDYDNDIGKTRLDIENIDNHLDIFYNEDELRKLIE